MMTRRWWVWIFGLIVGVTLVYFSYPVLASLYLEHKINNFVKVKIAYPGCVPGSSAQSQFQCECELVFEDQRDPSGVHFQGPGLRYRYDAQNLSYMVSGLGTIQSGANSVYIKSDRIFVNTTELPADRPSSWHVLIGRNGRLRSSRWDISW